MAIKNLNKKQIKERFLKLDRDNHPESEPNGFMRDLDSMYDFLGDLSNVQNIDVKRIAMIIRDFWFGYPDVELFESIEDFSKETKEILSEYRKVDADCQEPFIIEMIDNLN